MMEKTTNWSNHFIFFLVVAFVLVTWWATSITIFQPDMIHSAYNRVEPKKAQDYISRLMELLSSESYKQADPEVQKEAAMTFEAFLLQFGPALDRGKRTGETILLGRLRARMAGDKDAETL